MIFFDIHFKSLFDLNTTLRNKGYYLCIRIISMGSIKDHMLNIAVIYLEKSRGCIHNYTFVQVLGFLWSFKCFSLLKKKYKKNLQIGGNSTLVLPENCTN